MRPIKTLVIDDEPLALALLADYTRKTKFLELQAEFDNPLDARDFLDETPVDLIVLDIHMPDLSGVEFIKTLMHPPKIVFTTAFEKYAVEGYKLNAVDYLLKPFSYQEFLVAMQKVKRIIDLEKGAVTQIEASNEFLFLKSEYKIRKINFNDILYVEGMKDYVKVYLQSDKKPVLSINTVKSLEQKLPSDKFMRVHRSFIVNLEKIEVIERSRIVFGDKYIPISEQYTARFQEFLKKNFL